VTPTGPPIGGGGVPAGGIPGTPTKSGTPRIGQNPLFRVPPRRPPVLTPGTPKFGQIPDFRVSLMSGPPPPEGGVPPADPENPRQLGSRADLLEQICCVLGGTRFPGGRHRNVLRISGKKHEITADFGGQIPVNLLMFWVLNSAVRNVLNSG
jgi:hypothetical protein